MKTVATLQTTDNAIEQFYQKLLKSPEAQAQLKTASDPESLCQIAVNLGADMGYEFTIEQARAAMEIEVALCGEFKSCHLNLKKCTII
jgi:Nif11 domain